MPVVARHKSPLEPQDNANVSPCPPPFRSYSEAESKQSRNLDSVPTSSGFQPRKRKRRRILKSERLKSRRLSKAKISQFLRELGEYESATTLEQCGKRFSVLTCGEHIAAKLPTHRCKKRRLCPDCASHRANEFTRKYLPYMLEFKRKNPSFVPCLLTLTQIKIKGEKAADARKRMHKSFSKLIDQPFFKSLFAGGVWAAEMTFSEDSTHYHLHICCFLREFTAKKKYLENLEELKRRWAKVSKGAENLNLKVISDIESGLRECIKYSAKPMPASELERWHVSEILSLNGKQMIQTFGDFREFARSTELPEPEPEPERVKAEAGQCCAECKNGSKLFEMMMSDTDLERFYERVERYQIQKLSSVALREKRTGKHRHSPSIFN